MEQRAAGTACVPSRVLQRWLDLAKDHDVYMELDYGFVGVMGDPDGLPPRLARRLDQWMGNVIRKCRTEEQTERWLRLRLTQRGHILRMECEASGCPPESRGLREAGAHLEIEDMGESFWMALEAGLSVQSGAVSATERVEKEERT